jgi:hypothetical protein
MASQPVLMLPLFMFFSRLTLLGHVQSADVHGLIGGERCSISRIDDMACSGGRVEDGHKMSPSKTLIIEFVR